MTNPNPTAAPEMCENCRFLRPVMGGDRCFRYPQTERTQRGHWCGEFQPKPAPLDDRAPTPTPFAVSETPVGKRQSADERIGQGWSKEDFVDRRAAEDPYGPPIPHDGGQCPWPDEVGLVNIDEYGWQTSEAGRLLGWSWKGTSITAYRLRADHPSYRLLAYNAAHPDAPMTWWPGGEKAPEDWDGGKVLFKTGVTGNVAGRWTATIGYRQKAEAALDDLQHLGQAFDKVAEAPEPAADLVVLFKQAIGNRMIKAPHLPWYDFIDAALQAGGLRLVRDLSE